MTPNPFKYLPRSGRFDPFAHRWTFVVFCILYLAAFFARAWRAST